ncbi:MAG: hotdog fold thioesterase [Acidibacillus sp.]|uniref:Esterase n=1 Tax=Sulfoacidibacillus ferrooxidans TaxID=2005001 RepID=A0A9X1VD48_9BACL|nr:hotdog fold thioesterase [Sulfoacidibacillus ferrooxidans]MCI0183892.1 putative esterase [Sulfoacidibacillus ferrooxidans]MCY0893564.1 hotdog fold thioesterase [Acidibacillus sp.]
MTEQQRMTQNTMIEWLGIEIETLEPEIVIARMPVDHRTHQPAGILHGGASVVLAETVASVGSWNQINQDTHVAVGLEINANHVRSVSSGYVIATAVPLHRGRTTHIWNIRITDETDRLVCISRCTVAIVAKQS